MHRCTAYCWHALLLSAKCIDKKCIFVINVIGIMNKEKFIMKEAAIEHLDILAEFQVAMALETEDFQLDLSTVRKGVEACLLHPERGQYYVVENKETGKVVSCLMTMNEWSDWRCCWVVWLMSLYVLPDYRKNGIFKMMYSNLQDIVKADDALSGIRLYVDNRNIRAQKVYAALGMSGEHYSLLEWMKDE